jgi:nitric oxide dioxygenase
MTGQGMRFMRTLRVIVQELDEPEALRPYLEKLAQGHAAYGVKPEHFHPMGQALIWTMQQALGEDFPEGAAAAWEAAYDHLSREMIALAG